MKDLLVLYYSRSGSTALLARALTVAGRTEDARQLLVAGLAVPPVLWSRTVPPCRPLALVMLSADALARAGEGRARSGRLRQPHRFRSDVS